MIRLYVYAYIALALVLGVWGWTSKIRHDEAAKWRPKLEAAQRKTKEAETLAKGWEASFREAEAKREIAQRECRVAVTETQRMCNQRVKEARASAKIIREVVNEPVKLDENRCPVRAVIGAERLRDALQPG